MTSRLVRFSVGELRVSRRSITVNLRWALPSRYDSASGCFLRAKTYQQQQRRSKTDDRVSKREERRSKAEKGRLEPSAFTVESDLLIKTDLKKHMDFLASKTPESIADWTDSELESQEHRLDFSIDVKDLFDPAIHMATAPNWEKDGYESSTPLSNVLIPFLAVHGSPMTVAHFMRLALTHDEYGYYTNPPKYKNDDFDEPTPAASDGDESPVRLNDTIDHDWDEDGGDNTVASPVDHVIGAKGDFITAPEVSPLFGESILVWFVIQWQDLMKPKEVQLVEFGPGKGTLICDILRFAKTTLTDFGSTIRHVHLVEVSPEMRKRQQAKLEELKNELTGKDVEVMFKYVEAPNAAPDESKVIIDGPNTREEASEDNGHLVTIHWHSSVASVKYDSPKMPIFVICQEFIDALPVHVFQKTTEGVWRERMIDYAIKEGIESDEEGNTIPPPPSLGNHKLPRLRVVLAKNATPSLKTLLNVDDEGRRAGDDDLPEGTIVEVCPEGILLAQDIANLVEKHRGAGLIIDYGQDGSGDTLRGFSNHKQVPFFSRPGEVDVTADVDFSALRHAVNSRSEGIEIDKDAPTPVTAFGPITQGYFLNAMGALNRVSSMIEQEETTEEDAQELYDAIERLVQPEFMGERYKVLAIARKKDNIFNPAGF